MKFAIATAMVFSMSIASSSWAVEKEKKFIPPKAGETSESQEEVSQKEQQQSEQAQPEQGESEQGQPEQGQPEQGQPEQGQPEQGQPEQGQPESQDEMTDQRMQRQTQEMKRQTTQEEESSEEQGEETFAVPNPSRWACIAVNPRMGHMRFMGMEPLVWMARNEALRKCRRISRNFAWACRIQSCFRMH